MAADANAWVDQVTGCQKAVREDPEIGGHAFKAAMSNARSLIREFGSDEVVRELNLSGLSSHPGFLRMVVPAASAHHVPELEDNSGDRELRFL
jgi:hypothetical protein